MEVEILRGILDSNCYILSEGDEALIIDAGIGGDQIKEYLDENNLVAKNLILTHGHYDHVFYADDIREKLGVNCMIHEDDEEMLYDEKLNASVIVGRPITFKKADRVLKDGDKVEVLGTTAEIIHTPGHSKGCICIKIGNEVWTGDTLFNGSVGRVDLYGGSWEKIQHSIKEKLFNLDNDTKVYPGHGTTTTIGWQKTNNQFMK